MAIVGGIILDKMGIRRTGFGFILFMVAGSFLTAYGSSGFSIQGGLFIVFSAHSLNNTHLPLK
jgi:hypothetical protein